MGDPFVSQYFPGQFERRMFIVVSGNVGSGKTT